MVDYVGKLWEVKDVDMIHCAYMVYKDRRFNRVVLGCIKISTTRCTCVTPGNKDWTIRR